MPTTYTHYRFGKDVMMKLNPQIQKTIHTNSAPYFIGLHGPDLLFYHEPLFKNKISEIGFSMHHQKGKEFFSKAKAIIKENPDNNLALTAYIYGFICHFTLDSICHPYINELDENGYASHGIIEAEFDRDLLIKDGFDPLATKTTGHITHSSYTVNAIAPFFNEIPKGKIKKTLKSMKFYLDMLTAPIGFKRSFINTVLKATGKYESYKELLMSVEPEKACEQTNIELHRLYNEALPIAMRLINNYELYLNDEAELDEHFNHVFG